MKARFRSGEFGASSPNSLSRPALAAAPAAPATAALCVSLGQRSVSEELQGGAALALLSARAERLRVAAKWRPTSQLNRLNKERAGAMGPAVLQHGSQTKRAPVFAAAKLDHESLASARVPPSPLAAKEEAQMGQTKQGGRESAWPAGERHHHHHHHRRGRLVGVVSLHRANCWSI